MRLISRCQACLTGRRNLSSVTTSIRTNELGIQMIPEEWRWQLFGVSGDTRSSSSATINQVKSHLSSHGLWDKKNDKPSAPVTTHPVIDIKIPKLMGNDVSEHYYNIGTKYSAGYKSLASNYCSKKIPIMPEKWNFEPGWTRYEADGSFTRIQYPTSPALVLDVEVCVKYNLPVLAVAVDGDNWYSWVHERLVTQSASEDDDKLSFLKETTSFPHEELIPIGSSTTERLIIGHNIGFDRSYMKEQYNLQLDSTRFMDTMSLHISLSGLTGYQRALSISNIAAKKRGLSEHERAKLYRDKNQPDPAQWNDSGTLNNLKDVYAFYCRNSEGYQAISKDSRDTFVTGDMQDIRVDFQELMKYCAHDVKATSEIFQCQWPSFVTRFPHPITLAGMLEMSVTYLPVNSVAWKQYTDRSEKTYLQVMNTMKLQLTNLASKACHLLQDEQYKQDLWLWDVKWKTVDMRYRKNFSTTALYSRLSVQEDILRQLSHKSSGANIDSVERTILSILGESQGCLKNIQPLLPGYPEWYIDLCSKYKSQGETWHPGPHKLTTGIRIVPKLMRLTWDGYILHHTIQHGWGFLVPYTLDSQIPAPHNSNDPAFPYHEYIKLVKPLGKNQDPYAAAEDLEEERMLLNDALLVSDASNQYTANTEWVVDRPELRLDVNIPGCLFYKLPHKSGPEANVGNPLSRDFLHYIETGRLKASTGNNDVASVLLQMNKSTSYWRMSQKRILSQFVVSRPDGDDTAYESAILPRVVVAGAITRRAVEPTWLTASNAYKDRIGSELKSFIWSPNGWKFVGADVDSQELWLASVLGDAHFACIHGSTGIGWMNLEGTRASGTDLHSKTASIVNITRNEAKVLNYARIYGAGKAFAARFLKQSNPSLTVEEAECKARDIYKQTKGVKSNGRWKGGSESYLFNCLEKIALQKQPRTPVLSCCISKALEREDVKREFMTSIINWVVQSSAVDFLHIMLVTMKWLFEEQYSIQGRFAISIHDEVRYLVNDRDKYSAALALQITNLLTRAFICQQIGMNDLPASIAFFSTVEIDSVLRKDASTDAVTPSNKDGLLATYGIQSGESLDILQLMDKLQAKPNSL